MSLLCVGVRLRRGAPLTQFGLLRSCSYYLAFTMQQGGYVLTEAGVLGVPCILVATGMLCLKFNDLSCACAFVDPMQAVEAKTSSATGTLSCLSRACSSLLGWRLVGWQALLRASCSHCGPSWCGIALFCQQVCRETASCIGTL